MDDGKQPKARTGASPETIGALNFLYERGLEIFEPADKQSGKPAKGFARMNLVGLGPRNTAMLENLMWLAQLGNDANRGSVINVVCSDKEFERFMAAHPGLGALGGDFYPQRVKGGMLGTMFRRVGKDLGTMDKDLKAEMFEPREGGPKGMTFVDAAAARGARLEEMGALDAGQEFDAKKAKELMEGALAALYVSTLAEREIDKNKKALDSRDKTNDFRSDNDIKDEIRKWSACRTLFDPSIVPSAEDRGKIAKGFLKLGSEGPSMNEHYFAVVESILGSAPEPIASVWRNNPGSNVEFSDFSFHFCSAVPLDFNKLDWRGRFKALDKEHEMPPRGKTVEALREAAEIQTLFGRLMAADKASLGLPEALPQVWDYSGERTKELDPGLLRDALERHLQWGKIEDFFSSSYNMGSSCASAIGALVVRALHEDLVRQAASPDAKTAKAADDALARMEHRRWAGFVLGDGWKWSGSLDPKSRNNDLKLHHNLVPFDMLTKKDQDKDRIRRPTPKTDTKDKAGPAPEKAPRATDGPAPKTKTMDKTDSGRGSK